MTTVSQRCSHVASVPNNNICFKNDKNDVNNARTHALTRDYLYSYTHHWWLLLKKIVSARLPTEYDKKYIIGYNRYFLIFFYCFTTIFRCTISANGMRTSITSGSIIPSTSHIFPIWKTCSRYVCRVLKINKNKNLH